MKIRIGFVSNSSSSSFIVCGVEVSSNADVADVIKALDPEYFAEHEDVLTDEDIGTYELSEYVEDAFNGAGLGCHSDDWGSGVTIGVETDPTELSVSECLDGFVSESQRALLTRISEHVGTAISTEGGERQC